MWKNSLWYTKETIEILWSFFFIVVWFGEIRNHCALSCKSVDDCIFCNLWQITWPTIWQGIKFSRGHNSTQCSDSVCSVCLVAFIPPSFFQKKSKIAPRFVLLSSYIKNGQFEGFSSPNEYFWFYAWLPVFSFFFRRKQKMHPDLCRWVLIV